MGNWSVGAVAGVYPGVMIQQSRKGNRHDLETDQRGTEGGRLGACLLRFLGLVDLEILVNGLDPLRGCLELLTELFPELANFGEEQGLRVA